MPPTAEEEFALIRENTIRKFAQTLRTNATFVGKTQTRARNGSPLSTAPSEKVSLVELPESKVVTLKISPEKLKQSAFSSSISMNNDTDFVRPGLPRRKSSVKYGSPSEQHSSEGVRNATGNSSYEDNSMLITDASIRSTPAPNRRGTQDFEEDFVIPDLSKDSCITYAKRGVLRNVGSVRRKRFKEKGVVMGVRFIVG